jgi:hypothetical protein
MKLIAVMRPLRTVTTPAEKSSPFRRSSRFRQAVHGSPEAVLLDGVVGFGAGAQQPVGDAGQVVAALLAPLRQPVVPQPRRLH